MSSKSNIYEEDQTNQPHNQALDHRDDDALRLHAHEAFGKDGFNTLRAQLLARGHFVSPQAAEALLKRAEEETTGRAARRSLPKSRDRVDKSPSSEPPSNREPWTEEMTETVIRLHAQRIPFKQIAAQIPGKEVKGCQERYYRMMKEDQWKDMHDRLREEHDSGAT